MTGAVTLGGFTEMFAKFKTNQKNTADQLQYQIIAKDKILFKYAIQNMQTKKLISAWHNWILPYGLVYGVSDFYIARNNQSRWAVFHKDNPDQPISDWHNWIYPGGLIAGTSENYIVENEKGEQALFCASDKKQMLKWDRYGEP